jgi:hypothetical protein
MKQLAIKSALVAGLMAVTMSMARAETVKFEALVAQKEAIRLDFADGSKHFFLLVRREGKSEGQGVLADATVTEYGAHDIVPGVGGEPRGYLEFTKADGDKAYIKWTIQAIFVPGPDSKPKLLDNGLWQVVSGTGKLAKLKGAGSFHLVATGPQHVGSFLKASWFNSGGDDYAAESDTGLCPREVGCPLAGSAVAHGGCRRQSGRLH